MSVSIGKISMRLSTSPGTLAWQPPHYGSRTCSHAVEMAAYDRPDIVYGSRIRSRARRDGTETERERQRENATVRISFPANGRGRFPHSVGAATAEIDSRDRDVEKRMRPQARRREPVNRVIGMDGNVLDSRGKSAFHSVLQV